MLGLPLFVRNHGTAPVYDPAALSLTGWWRASYGGSPWAGTASAGGSGSRSLSEGTNAPSVGAGLGPDGWTAADFDGTNDILANGTAISTLLSASAWSIAILATIDAVSGVANPGLGDIISDTGGYWCIGSWVDSGSKVFIGQWDGAQKGAGTSTAITTGTPQLIQAKYDGANLLLRVNGGSWASEASGNIQVATGTLFVGRNYTAGSFFNGKIWDVLTTNSALSDATFDDIKSYVNARYALSL